MIVGKGSSRFGMGGMPNDNADLDRNTNDWSTLSRIFGLGGCTYRSKTRMGSNPSAI